MHAHSGGRNSEEEFSLFACTATCNGTDCNIRATSLHLSTRLSSPQPLTVLLRHPCSTFYIATAPSKVHAPTLLQPAAAPLGKSALIPHRLALTPPEAATLHHSPLLRATPRPGVRTVLQLGATPLPDAGPICCSPSRRVCSSTQRYHRSSKSTATTTTAPFDNAAPV